jgi:hypothetical protein
MATKIFDIITYNAFEYFTDEDVFLIGITDNERECWINANNKELIMSQLQSETITIPALEKATKSMQALYNYIMDFDCGLNIEVDDDMATHCMKEAGVKSLKNFFDEIKADVEKFGLDDCIDMENNVGCYYIVYGNIREKFSRLY